jgi:hypothetical protein
MMREATWMLAVALRAVHDIVRRRMLLALMMLRPVASLSAFVASAASWGCHDVGDSSSASTAEGSESTGASSTSSGTGAEDVSESQSSGEVCEAAAPVGEWEICDEIAALAPICDQCYTDWHVDFCNRVYDDILEDNGSECVAASEAFERCWWTTCDFETPISEDHPCYALGQTMIETCDDPRRHTDG